MDSRVLRKCNLTEKTVPLGSRIDLEIRIMKLLMLDIRLHVTYIML